MSYNTLIPATGHSGSQDYQGMQANFLQIQNSFSVNHEPLASGGGTEGYHTQIQLANVLGSDPNIAAPVSSLYTKGTPPELFFQNGALAANVFQLTGNITNASGPNVSIEYQVITPWGLILKFGTTTMIASGTVVDFPVAFPGAVYGVISICRLAGFCQNGVNNSAQISFTPYFSAAGNQVVYYFAWGN